MTPYDHAEFMEMSPILHTELDEVRWLPEEYHLQAIRMIRRIKKEMLKPASPPSKSIAASHAATKPTEP